MDAARIALASLAVIPLAHAAAPDVLHELQELTVPAALPDELVAWSVAVDGDTLAIGSWTTPGRVDVFGRAGGAWVHQATLAPEGATHVETFGTCVALEGDTLVVGASGEDLGGGALYLFERANGVWGPGLRMTLPGVSSFGSAVDLDGERLAVGAASGAGAVVLLERVQGAWQVAEVLHAVGGSSNERFGSALALQGDRLVAGAPNHAEQRGRAYAFRRTAGGGWLQVQVLEPDALEPHAAFGSVVALDGERLAIGAPASNFPPLGSVVLFEHHDDAWHETARLLTPTGSTTDRFGSALALRGDQLVVGAHIGHGGTGDVYVFERFVGVWERKLDLVPLGLDFGMRFGFSIAATGDEVVVGAPYGEPAGSAFVFALSPPPTFGYCDAEPNSSGRPCLLGSTGSTSVAANELVLLARDLPPGAALLLCGQQPAQIPMASGTLCISPFYPGLFRLGAPVPAGQRDFASFALDLDALPAGCEILAGSTWYFQLWFRDANPAGYGLSDGLGASFVP